jgi:hypothetical protein
MSGFRLPTPPSTSESSSSSSSEEEEEDEEEEEQLPYCPSTPYFIDLEYDRRNQQESYYQAIFNINDIPKFNPSFELPCPGVEPSAAALLELFFPDMLLDKWVQCTNAYAASLLPPTKRKRVRDALKYVLTMDNYFNQPITIESVQKANVGSIGTFRRQRAWHPKEYKRVKDNRYNTVYSLEDQERNLD